MSEKPSPWVVAQELDQTTADARRADHAVDVYHTPGPIPDRRFFRVFLYGNSRQGLEEVRDSVQASARFTILHDPEIVGPMKAHFDQRNQGKAA